MLGSSPRRRAAARRAGEAEARTRVSRGEATDRGDAATGAQPSCSSTKHQRQDSPGLEAAHDRVVVLARSARSRACAARSRSSPTCPQSRHSRRCTQVGAVAHALLAAVRAGRRHEPVVVAGQVLALVLGPLGGSIGSSRSSSDLRSSMRSSIDSSMSSWSMTCAEDLLVDGARVADPQQLRALGLEHDQAHPAVGLARRLGRLAGPWPSRSQTMLVRLSARDRERSTISRSASSRSSSAVSPAATDDCRMVASCRASSRGSGPRTPRRLGQPRQGQSLQRAGSHRDGHGQPAPGSLRCGVSAGSVNAAASVTTPRIPAHEMIAPCGPGRWYGLSPLSNWLNSSRVGKTQSGRSSTTVGQHGHGQDAAIVPHPTVRVGDVADDAAASAARS